jgi:hypothetical protein
MQHGKLSLSDEEIRDKILHALKNRAYQSRTVKGIARESKVSEETIRNALINNKRLAVDVKILPFKSNTGEVLIMDKGRFVKEASFKTKFIDYFASNRVGVKDV